MSDLAKYVGIPYDHGSTDCFGLMRRYYLEVWGLRLPNFARPNAFWEDPNLDLTRLYKKMGFEVVIDENPQIGDGLLMPLLTPMNTHTAALVNDHQILHHLPDRLSSLDRLRPSWLARTTVVLRHPHVTAMQKQNAPTVHFHEVSHAPVFRDPRFKETVASLLGSKD